MATDLTPNVKGNKLPGRRNARSAIVLERYLTVKQLEAAKGSAVAQGDEFNVMHIPSGTHFLGGGAEIVNSEGNAGTFSVDVGFAGGDNFVDGGDMKGSAGSFLAGGSNGSPTNSGRRTTDETLDLTIASLSGDPEDDTEVRVYVIVADVSGGPPTARPRDYPNT